MEIRFDSIFFKLILTIAYYSEQQEKLTISTITKALIKKSGRNWPSEIHVPMCLINESLRYMTFTF